MSNSNRKQRNKTKKQNAKPKVRIQEIINVRSRGQPKSKKRSRRARNGSMARRHNNYSAGEASSYGQLQRDETIWGCDFIGTVTFPTSAASSTVSNRYVLNPLTLAPSSRLAQFAPLWDKYQWKELELIYVPSASDLTAGSISVSVDSDPLEDLSNIVGDLLTAKMSATAHNCSIKVNHEHHLKIRDRSFFDRLLYVAPDAQSDPRNVFAGAITVASTGALPSGTYGRLWIKWKVRFSCPNLDSLSGAGTAVIITVDAATVTSTYPWGDFDAIKSAFATGSNYGYLPNDSVTFSSSTSLGSVITFNTTGFFIINMYQTGASMGVGAFTSEVVYLNCSNVYPANDANFGGAENFSLVNGGLTARMWTNVIYVSQLPAQMSCTGDSGITHSTSYVFVHQFAVPLTQGGGLPGPLGSALEKFRWQREIDGLIENRLSQLNLIESKSRRLTSGHTPVSGTEDTTSTLDLGAGCPPVQISSTSTVSMEVDSELNPVVTETVGMDPIAAGLKPINFDFKGVHKRVQFENNQWYRIVNGKYYHEATLSKHV